MNLGIPYKLMGKLKCFDQPLLFKIGQGALLSLAQLHPTVVGVLVDNC
jgi:hypothetical protein